MEYKKTKWLGQTLEDLKTFPDEVRQHIGYALYQAQLGLTHEDAKPLKGFKPMVWEIASRHRGNAYRAIYTVVINDVVYILHLFQKKSTRGIATPKKEIDIIKKRLQLLLAARKE